MKRTIRRIMTLMLIAALLTGLLPFAGVKKASAAVLKIRYNGQKIKFDKQIIDVSIDGKKLPMSASSPNLELVNDEGDERYMVSITDVFVNGLGASYKYDKSSKLITLSLYGTTIEMTLNDTYAFVNGEGMEMPHAPVEVTYVKSRVKKILVDSMFVTNALGFGYSWQNNSETSGSVFITTPILYSYGGNTYVYKDKDWTVTYDNKACPFGDIKTPHIGEVLFVPAKKLFASKIGASYSADSANKTITLEKNGAVLTMTQNSTEALLNGEPVTLNQAPCKVRWKKAKKSCIMVPLMQVAYFLNLDCSIDDNNHRADITRQDTVYGEWTVKNPPAEPDAEDPLTPPPAITTPSAITTPPAVEYEYARLATVSALRVNKEDVLCFYTDKKAVHYVEETPTKIVITFENTVSSVGNIKYDQKDPYLLRKFRVKQTFPDETEISIYKKKNKSYTLNTTSEYVKINIINQDIIMGNGIKIAIDCGHGNDTAGKRTPPMPFAIDIDGDGVNDIKKGEQYREHYASVGVGKYLYKALKRCDFQVYQSAFGAEDIPLVTRQSNIKSEKCDYSVCIHWNAFGDGRSFNTAEGLGVYYYSQAAYAGDSKNFAAVLQKNLLKGTPQKDRGIDGQNQYAMCNCKFLGTKASVLIELAFMTNKKEATTMMANSEYWEEAAEEICKGICEYTGVKYIEP